MNPAFSLAAIKDILRSCLPANKHLNKYDVFYTRIRCRRLMGVYKENPRYESFVTALSQSDLVLGLDESSITEDECLTIGKEIWAELLNRNQDHEESLVCFQDFLLQMKERVNGFDYCLATDRKGYCNGVVWQTATMRKSITKIYGIILSPIQQFSYFGLLLNESRQPL